MFYKLVKKNKYFLILVFLFSDSGEKNSHDCIHCHSSAYLNGKAI